MRNATPSHPIPSHPIPTRWRAWAWAWLLILVVSSQPARAQGSPQPGLQVFATATQSTICQGGSTVLRAYTDADDPGTTYAWTPNQDLSATSGERVVVNPLQTTTYTVAATLGGRTARRTITIAVQADCCQTSRFTFPTGLTLPPTSQVAQTQADFSVVLPANTTLGIATQFVPTTVTGTRFEQADTAPYPKFNYAQYRPRQVGLASYKLEQVLDNTFLGLAEGVTHTLRDGDATAEVRGNAFVACEKGYVFRSPFSYPATAPTGTAYLTCNTFARGVSANVRAGVSYGIYQEANANVTLANINPSQTNPAAQILKNLFDDTGAGVAGYYALYNASNAQQLNYVTYDDYWNTTVFPLVNTPAVVLQSAGFNYPNNNTDCHLTSPATGLQRIHTAATTDANPVNWQPTLEQNVPNPAHGATRIRYATAKNARETTLWIRRVTDGQLMVTQSLNPAANQCDLSLKGLPAGLCFYTLVIDGAAAVTRRLVVE